MTALTHAQPDGYQHTPSSTLVYFGVAPEALHTLADGAHFSVVYMPAGYVVLYRVERDPKPLANGRLAPAYVVENKRELTDGEREHFRRLVEGI